MALSRYALRSTVKGGKSLNTGTGMSKIYNACIAGELEHEIFITKENQRLDHLAGLAYQSSTYWWVIAAASGIGWGLQVPPGTVLRIPVSVADALGYL